MLRGAAPGTLTLPWSSGLCLAQDTLSRGGPGHSDPSSRPCSLLSAHVHPHRCGHTQRHTGGGHCHSHMDMSTLTQSTWTPAGRRRHVNIQWTRAQGTFTGWPFLLRRVDLGPTPPNACPALGLFLLSLYPSPPSFRGPARPLPALMPPFLASQATCSSEPDSGSHDSLAPGGPCG